MFVITDRHTTGRLTIDDAIPTAELVDAKAH